MYFEFEEHRPAPPTLETPISRREGVLLSIIVHLLMLIVAILLPRLPAFRDAAERAEQVAQERQALALEQQREAQRFVFVQPRVDLEALRPPERGELSDQDRLAQAPERAPDPENPLPFARGNTPERVEAEREPPPEGAGPVRQPRPPPSAPPQPTASAETGDSGPADTRGSLLADATEALLSRTAPGRMPGASSPPPAGGGLLGDSRRTLDRYLQEDSFGNPGGGGGAYGPSIQFDTKGVDFGPWIRRFVAQIKRNWLIPYAAMALRGHVAITFNVHRDGRLSELQVAAPSGVDAFNNAAFNALVSTNPTQPLPPEYPDDQAFFTVTFYYNEMPPSR